MLFYDATMFPHAQLYIFFARNANTSQRLCWGQIRSQHQRCIPALLFENPVRKVSHIDKRIQTNAYVPGR